MVDVGSCEMDVTNNKFNNEPVALAEDLTGYCPFLSGGQVWKFG